MPTVRAEFSLGRDDTLTVGTGLLFRLRIQIGTTVWAELGVQAHRRMTVRAFLA